MSPQVTNSPQVTDSLEDLGCEILWTGVYGLGMEKKGSYCRFDREEMGRRSGITQVYLSYNSVVLQG